jgi:hypothetical protein
MLRTYELLLKFNLVLLLVFGSGVTIAGYLSHDFLERSARDEVLEQARLMMGAAGGMRTYTSKQVGPLLKAHQQRINRFLPQTVPAYSATEVFGYLRSAYPDYSYKEASLNPTNLRNRAVDWETDIIQIFRNHPDKKEFWGVRDTPGGKVLFLAKPLLVDMTCLQCHSTPDQAPRISQTYCTARHISSFSSDSLRSRELPSTYSIIMRSSLPTRKTVRKEVMFGCSNLARTLISRANLSASSGSASAYDRRLFMASTLSEMRLRTLKTRPIPPRPSRPMIS